ncbi:hypothetical protein ACE6H2_006837 [Prunus campanulata]
MPLGMWPWRRKGEMSPEVPFCMWPWCCKRENSSEASFGRYLGAGMKRCLLEGAVRHGLEKRCWRSVTCGVSFGNAVLL